METALGSDMSKLSSFGRSTKSNPPIAPEKIAKDIAVASRGRLRAGEDNISRVVPLEDELEGVLAPSNPLELMPPGAHHARFVRGVYDGADGDVTPQAELGAVGKRTPLVDDRVRLLEVHARRLRGGK